MLRLPLLCPICCTSLQALKQARHVRETKQVGSDDSILFPVLRFFKWRNELQVTAEAEWLLFTLYHCPLAVYYSAGSVQLLILKYFWSVACFFMATVEDSFSATFLSLQVAERFLCIEESILILSQLSQSAILEFFKVCRDHHIIQIYFFSK